MRLSEVRGEKRMRKQKERISRRLVATSRLFILVSALISLLIDSPFAWMDRKIDLVRPLPLKQRLGGDCCLKRNLDETCFSLLQFSKDKYLLESPPEKLRKELEEELKLSAADIRSHGWYHGHIPREVRTAQPEPHTAFFIAVPR